MRRLESYLLQYYKGCETQHLRSIRGFFKWFFTRYFSYTSFAVSQFPNGLVGWIVVGWILHKIRLKTIWIRDETWQKETWWGGGAREKNGTYVSGRVGLGIYPGFFQESHSLHLRSSILSVYHPFHSQCLSLFSKLYIHWN